VAQEVFLTVVRKHADNPDLDSQFCGTQEQVSKNFLLIAPLILDRDFVSVSWCVGLYSVSITRDG